MEPSTNDRQPDPSSDSELSKTQSPTAATENGQAADSLFDGDETPASESQSQTPAPSQPGNQDNDNQGPGAQSHSEASPPTSETQTSAHPEGRPETQNESQQHTQPAPPRLNNSSIPSSTAPHPNGHPNTNTTANNGPPPGGPHTNIHPRPAPSPHPNGLYGMLCPPPPDPGPKPVPPAPVVHGPFTYDEDGFKALAFKRETPYNLHMIMRDPNAAPPVEPVAKAWFHAQLIHYGIPVHQSPLGAEPLPQDLFSALETALRNETIKEGKLPPANILTIEDNLRRQFKDIYKQYQEAFRYWEQQTFARCNTPNDEINCNLDLFMAKYFLRGIRGPPDPKKSRYPIILHKLNDYDGVRKVVKAVPGLRSHMMPLWSVICWEEYGIERAIEEAFASISASHPSITMHVPTLEAHFHIDHFLSKYWLTGLYGRPMPMLTPEPIVIEGWFGGPDIRNILTQAVLRVPDLRVWAFIGNGIDKTVIGWGDKPFHLVEHMRKTSLHQQVASAAPQRVEVQGNPTWDLALRPHFQLCQVKADLLQSNPQHAYEPFEIQELVGSWLVRCPDLENGGWGGRPGEMTIDILNWPVDSYGLVASINLKVALGTMILARSEQLLDELSAYLLHDREVLPHIPHQKRRRGDDFFVAYPRRRSPYEPVPPMRIFFDWIGRRADEFNVELDMDPSNRNRGWVDIDMNNKVFGKGWLKYVKFFGKDNPVAFSMYKVTDQPKKMPEQWSNFRPKEMEAQLQRRVQEQMQRPIAEPNWPSTSTSTNIMITSKIPKPASDHTLPPRPPRPPPPRPPSTTPSPTIKITSKIPKPASDHTLPQQPPGPPPPPTQAPPTDLPGFQRIRPREPPQGIQIGLHTVPAKKRTRPKEGHNKAPRVVDDVQKQGNAAAREGGEGQGERATSTWTPTEGEGREEGYRSAEEEEEEEEQDDGREKGQKDEQQAIDDGQQGDEEEQGEKEKAQAHEGEQEEGRKEQEQQPEKGAQQDEEEDQNQEEQEDQGDEEEEEDDLEGIYQTPAEEVPPSAAPWTEPDAEEQQKDGGDGQQEQKDDQQDAVEEEDDRDVDRDDEEKEQEERQEQQQEDGEELDDQPEKEKEKEEDGRPTKEQGSSAL
ncbi:hypothetical protein QBC32DRAFT_375933 [Pseudoneurospora amorphoporcata]|uniref:Uncharacterized protein n=1 Tax=Pseudoneurospora amorphoporcata TaxID=241081 RepID=A0AAN6NRQ8_9PEZI|nr:hypothetical protein QBC32DRAFT_375933 [Pseudoneurospora amorphoporcata]